MKQDAAAPLTASEDGSSDSGLQVDGFTAFLRGTPSPASDPMGPGTRIGDVTIVRLIGEGGMGRVYEALQGMPCRTVAVKVVRPGVLSRAASRRFEHEVQILGRLTHPGICRIYSVGLHEQPEGDVPFFVMEFVDDALAMTEYAARHGLSIRDRVALFREVCGAVAYGHQKGVIHRDLKPGNILVDSAGRPKVIDFGVARSTDADVTLTTLHTDVAHLVGTLVYMAPEQFDGVADDIDMRADVYALGLVLHELLTGSLPYDVKRRAVHEVARIVRDVEPRALSSVDPKLRGDLDTIVTTCLAKERGRRYSSASEIEAELGRYLRGEPIAARRPSVVDAVGRLARRHRVAAVAAVGVVASLLLAMAGISVFAIRAERQREVAVAAERLAMHEARVAVEQRDAADRERARADSEAVIARGRLYVANLRAMRSSLEAKNLRMARSLYEDNVALVGGDLPIEMRCLAAGLDEAVVVLHPQAGPISTIAFNADATRLSVLPGRSTATTSNPRPLPHGVSFLVWQSPLAYAIRDDGRYEQVHDADPAEIGGRDRSTVKTERARTRDVTRIDPNRIESSAILAESGDGRLLAEPTASGGIRIVGHLREEDHVVIDGLRGRLPDRLAFTAGNTRLLTQRADRLPELWDAETGRFVASCGGPGRSCEQYVISPDGSRIAVVIASGDGRHDVSVHETIDGRRLCDVTIPPKHAWGESILAFTPDGRRLITCCRDSDLTVFDCGDGARVGSLRGHAAIVTALAISSDGRHIASGAANGHIRVWNAEAFDCVRELIGHTGGVSTLQFRDDRSLASGSQDGTVRIWEIGGPTRLSTLADIRGMTAVAYRPDGTQLAVASTRPAGVHLWDPRTVRKVHSLAESGGAVAQLAYSSDGSLLAAAVDEPGPVGGVRVWETTTGRLVLAVKDQPDGVIGVAFNADGSRLLATSREGMITAWDLRSTRLVMAEPFGFRSGLAKTAAIFGMDGRRVACGRPELLDGESGEVAVKLDRQGLVSCLASSPDGRTLATGVAIGDVMLADFSTGERLTKFVGHHNVVRAIAFDGDGKRLVVGSQDGTLRVWDARQRGRVTDEMLLLAGHEGSVDRVAFTPDGSRLITGSMDGSIRIWDASLGHELLVLPGQREEPKAFAISPDGMHVVSAGLDGIPTIWGRSNTEVFEARTAADATINATASPSQGRPAAGVGDRGNVRGEHGVPGLFEAAEEGGEIRQILPVQAERPEER